MSLDWDIGDVDNYLNVCWIKDEHEDNKKLNPVTESLVFTTMSVGINHITKNNLYDFYLRTLVVADVYGMPLTYWNADQTETRNFTLEEVKQHIGLSTNASTFTANQFMKKMIEAKAKYDKQAVTKRC